MLAWMLLILTCPLPYVESHMDVIELNHVYDYKAKHKLSQVILWRDGHVAWHWTIASKQPEYQQDSVRQWAGDARRVNGQWRMDVRHRGRWYRVVAPSYRETWTQWDPEVLDKEKLHALDRGGL